MIDLNLAMSLGEKLLDKFPSYSQAKKRKYYELRKEYDEEISKDYPYYDDERIIIVRRELRLFWKTFLSEISTS